MASVDLVKPIMELPVAFVSAQWLYLPSNITFKDFQVLYDYVYVYPYSADRSAGYQLAEAAHSSAQSIMSAIRSEVHKSPSITDTMKSVLGRQERSEKHDFVSKFKKNFHHKSIDDVSNELFAFLVSVVPIWGLIMVNVVDSLLQPGSKDKQGLVEDLVTRHRGGDNDALKSIEEQCVSASGRELPIGRIARMCQRTLQYQSEEELVAVKNGEDIFIVSNEGPMETPGKAGEEESVDAFTLFDYGGILKQLILEVTPRVLDNVFSRQDLKLTGPASVQRFRAPVTPAQCDTSQTQSEWMYQGNQGGISRWPQDLPVMFEKDMLHE